MFFQTTITVLFAHISTRPRAKLCESYVGLIRLDIDWTVLNLRRQAIHNVLSLFVTSW